MSDAVRQTCPSMHAFPDETPSWLSCGPFHTVCCKRKERGKNTKRLQFKGLVAHSAFAVQSSRASNPTFPNSLIILSNEASSGVVGVVASGGETDVPDTCPSVSVGLSMPSSGSAW